MFNSFLAIWIGYKLASFVTLFLKIREGRMKLLCSTELTCLGGLDLGENFDIKTYVWFCNGTELLKATHTYVVK